MGFSFHLFCSFSLEQLQRIAFSAQDVLYKEVILEIISKNRQIHYSSAYYLLPNV